MLPSKYLHEKLVLARVHFNLDVIMGYLQDRQSVLKDVSG